MQVVAPFLLLAAANSAPAPGDSEIVVRGQRDRERQIVNFIRDMTPAPVGGQLSRFDVAVCPVVIGLRRERAISIADRLRRVAKAVNMRVAKPECEPNVILVIAENKTALLGQIEKRRPEYFPPEWSGFRVHEVQRDPSPVAAWHFRGMFWADGRPVASDSASSVTDIAQLQRTIEPPTRLKPSTRKDLLTAIVIVQESALDGLTTTQLADYVAMRAFVQTEPKRLGAASGNSILAVIDAPMGSSVPLTLTAWDLSFLKAFYASNRNSYATYQRSEMRRLMTRELDKVQSTQQ